MKEKEGILINPGWDLAVGILGLVNQILKMKRKDYYHQRFVSCIFTIHFFNKYLLRTLQTLDVFLCVSTHINKVEFDGK